MASAAIKRAVPQEPYPGIEPLGGVVVVVSARGRCLGHTLHQHIMCIGILHSNSRVRFSLKFAQTGFTGSNRC